MSVQEATPHSGPEMIAAKPSLKRPSSSISGVVGFGILSSWPFSAGSALVGGRALARAVLAPAILAVKGELKVVQHLEGGHCC